MSLQTYNCSSCYMEMSFDSDRLCFCCEHCQNTYVLIDVIGYTVVIIGMTIHQ
jgi:hypothetical protein